METTPTITETIVETMETIAETIPEVHETVPVETIAETITETVETIPQTNLPETTGTVVTFEEYQGLSLDIIHADLFGSFLVCGTLAGIALLWRFR